MKNNSLSYLPAISIVSGSDLNNQETSRNNEYLNRYLNIKRNNLLTQNVETRKSYLHIPVNIITFYQYYKKISFGEYLDKYSFDDQIYVFDNRRPHDYSSRKYKNSFQWLRNIRHLQEYEYTKWQGNASKKSNLNINWINGFSDSNSNLKSILNMSLPNSKGEKFTSHKKEIILRNDFFHKSEIKHFASYWRQGYSNSSNNILLSMKYGKLKSNPSHWLSNYRNAKTKKKLDCGQVTALNDNNFGSAIYMYSDGFDSQCNQINLNLNGSPFHRQTGFYTSGYAGFKYEKPNHWDNYYYYYLLGNTSSSNTYKNVLDIRNSDETIWYVNYEKIFVPSLVKRDNNLKLKIDIDYSKIPNIDKFLKISSAFNFDISFQLNNLNKNLSFNLEQILSGHEFELKELKNHYFFTLNNFKLQVKNTNSFVSMLGTQNTDFLYSLNTTKIEKQHSIFANIVFNMLENEIIFYSELQDKKRIKNLFYLTTFEKPKELISISDDAIDFLNFESTGSDDSENAKISYFDFSKNIKKIIELNNLQNIQNIKINDYLSDQKIWNISIAKETLKNRLGEYFANNIYFKLESKNIFDGFEKYSIVSTHEDTPTKELWDKSLKDQVLRIENGKLKYIEQLESYQLNDKNKLTSEKIKEYFFVTKSGKENGFKIDDFNFEIKEETNQEATVFVTSKKNDKQHMSKTYKLIKTIEKLEKNEKNYPAKIFKKTSSISPEVEKPTEQEQLDEDSNKSNTVFGALTILGLGILSWKIFDSF